MLRLLLPAALALALSPSVPAQAPPYAAADQAGVSEAPSDPPSRAARLSYIDGAVSLQPAGLEEWNSAPLNQPLTSGDSLWIDGASHAEVDLGASMLRLGERTALSLLDLKDQALQLRLNVGTLELTLAAADAPALEVDAPEAAVLLARPGEYRLDVDNRGDTSIAIRSGLAQVQSGDEQNTTLKTGQRGLYGAGGSAVTQALAPDEFDRWCQQREARALERQGLDRYVSSDVVGEEDLNDYGQWQQLPDYGNVWFPTQVADDWAPYSTGHWAWVAPWGWSWVDEAPWGFAPFHYGRWAHFGRRWGWIPVPPHRHALYAPALVAWMGGPAVALGGGAAVGWLPLAPGEVYVPPYRASTRYLQNLNLSASSNLSAAYVASVIADPALQNRYANRAIAGALSVVSQVSFAAGQSVARHRLTPPTPWQSATPLARVPAIVPSRASLLGAIPLARIARPPAQLMTRAVLMQHTPPAAVPSFDLQQPAIAANGGRPLDAAELGKLRRASLPAPLPSPDRGIAQRAPTLPPPAQRQGSNVFRQRDQALQQQREAQLQAQQAQRQAQLLQQQQHLQEQQQAQAEQRLQPQTPPPHPAASRQPQTPPPAQRSQPEVPRPEPPPLEQRELK